MKQTFLIVLLIHIVELVWPQADTTKHYLLTTKVVSYGISTPHILDPYLSPMTYSGTGIKYETNSSKYLSSKKTDYSTQGKLVISANLLQNPSQSGEMQLLGVKSAWGINYHIPIKSKIRILVGGLWDVDFGFKNVPRNQNNPINVDLATNINLAGSMLYDLNFLQRKFCFRMVLSSPILGYMFVPQAGTSYYNMFSIGNMANTFHLSSFHNKQGLYQSYSVDVPMNKITWRLGVNVQQLKYTANKLVFVQDDLSFMIGTSFDIISFSGTKKKAPRNFISTNE